MDFSLTDDQVAVRDLARRIFTDRVTGDRLKEVEAGADGYDRSLWRDLGSSNLLGVALPEESGGTGYGLVELGLVLEEAGAAAAPVPLVSSIVLGALPVAAFGSNDQQQQVLPPVVSGEAVLTAALAGVDPLDPSTVRVEAGPNDTGWRLEGVAEMVPLADSALRILLPARTADGETRIFLLDPAAARFERQELTSGPPAFRVEVDTGVSHEDALGGTDVLRWMVDRAAVAVAILQVGIGERALEITAEYVAGREQFERPLATFQAVQQRIADAYVDVLAMRWTAWRALWRLAEGLPADEEIAVAKFWASDAGPRVVEAAQHLHGGMGVDVDYPLHRYTKAAKSVELGFGGATTQLERLGDLIAS